ncbi:MAG: MYG1 family protein [Candidatus Paceibacterota bacterium]
MMKTIKINKLVTHDGPFHSDDIFACATIALFLEKKKEKFKIIRTRDEKIINNGDYVFDIGGIYNEKKNIFDHHQKGGAGKRSNGIEYASFGLVWKKFGPKISGSSTIASAIDESLVSPIDADDNGIDLFKSTHDVSPFLLQDFFKLMRPISNQKPENYDKNFLKSVKVAKEILSRIIIRGKNEIQNERIVARACESAVNKKIIILDKYYPPGKTFYKFPKALFIIFPKEIDHSWVIKTIKKNGEGYKSRKDFPSMWGGLQDKELQKVSGIKEAVFCHKGLFLAVAKTKEGAIKLAQIAVES